MHTRRVNCICSRSADSEGRRKEGCGDCPPSLRELDWPAVSLEYAGSREAKDGLDGLPIVEQSKAAPEEPNIGSLVCSGLASARQPVDGYQLRGCRAICLAVVPQTGACSGQARLAGCISSDSSSSYRSPNELARALSTTRGRPSLPSTRGRLLSWTPIVTSICLLNYVTGTGTAAAMQLRFIKSSICRTKCQKKRKRK